MLDDCGPVTGRDAAALAELAALARAEMALLSYPDRAWVEPRATPDGTSVHAVVVVGAGQSGLAIAHGLRREGVRDVVLLDRQAEGGTGVWQDFARMDELRTPKILNGMEFGQPSLSVRNWYIAAHGVAAWDALERIPRAEWAAYLRWYRATVGLDVTAGAAISDIAPCGEALAITQAGHATPMLARTVVLATGHAGAGEYAVPEVVAQALPPERYDHSNGPIDFDRLRGRRVGVLGHGASAFDAAVAALRAGAARVDLCFRRATLPTANPHRFVETGGFMTHFPALPDAVRWQVARQFRVADQPPAEGGFRAALALPGFRMHAGSPWLRVALEDDAIIVDTPRARAVFDHVICATGLRPDLHARPELRSVAGCVALWGERHAAEPDAVGAALAAYPYLGPEYQFEPRHERDGWVRRVFAFNAASVVSQGPHSTSISGHRHAVPRLVRGVTRALFLEQAESLLHGLRGYDAPDLVLPRDMAA